VLEKEEGSVGEREKDGRRRRRRRRSSRRRRCRWGGEFFPFFAPLYSESALPHYPTVGCWWW